MQCRVFVDIIVPAFYNVQYNRNKETSVNMMSSVRNSLLQHDPALSLVLLLSEPALKHGSPQGLLSTTNPKTLGKSNPIAS